MRPSGSLERRDRVDLLAREVKRRAARHQQLHGRSRRQRAAPTSGAASRRARSCRARAGARRSRRCRASASPRRRLVGHAEGLRDRRQDEAGVRERRKVDEEDAVGKVVEELGRGLLRQPRLARAAGAGQGDDPASGRRSRSRAPGSRARGRPEASAAAGGSSRGSRGCGAAGTRRPSSGDRELEHALSRRRGLAAGASRGRRTSASSKGVSRRRSRVVCERRICPGWAALPDARRTADAGARVAAVGGDRFRRVDADRDASGAPGRPLDPDRGRHGVASAGEGNERRSRRRVSTSNPPCCPMTARTSVAAPTRSASVNRNVTMPAGFGRLRGVPQRRERIRGLRARGPGSGSAARAAGARGWGRCPSSSTSTSRASWNASRASACLPARYSASISCARRPSRSGFSAIRRSSSGTTSSCRPSSSSALNLLFERPPAGALRAGPPPRLANAS